MKPRFNRAYLILNWIVFAAFVGYGFGWMGTMSDLSRAYTLQAHGVRTVAQVQSVTNGDSLNSAKATFTFNVAGRQYYGYSPLSERNTSLAPGFRLEAVYLPADPSTNSIDLDGLRDSGKHGLVIAAILEAITAAIFLPLILFSGTIRGMVPTSKIVPKGNLIAGGVILSVMLIAGLSALFFSAIPGYAKAGRLASAGQPAVAQITAVYDRDKGKGRYAEYSFRVNGVNYNGQADYQGNYSDRGPINITYLPEDPSFSDIDPNKKLTNMKVAIPFLIVWNLIVGAVFVGLVTQWRRSRLL